MYTSIGRIIAILNVESKTALKLARETHKILVYHAGLPGSGKVRELVGELKYAFDCNLMFKQNKTC